MKIEDATGSDASEACFASESRPRPRALFVTLAYPPAIGVGSLRTAGFARHLPDFGWDVTVVTVHDKHLGQHHDADLLRFARDDVEVVRVTSPLYLMNHNLQKAMAFLKRRRAGDGHPTNPVANQRHVATGFRGSRMLRAFGIVNDWLFMRQADLPWAMCVRAKCVREARRADVIISSAPPIGSHVAAGLLARRTRRPWIADFRDLYSATKRGQPTRFHDEIARRLERWCVRTADRIVTASDAMAQRLMNTNASVEPSRFVTITNGFDRLAAAGFERATEAEGRRKMRISHVGRIYETEGRTTFLHAIKSLIDEGTVPRDGIEFELVGHVIPDEVQQVHELGLERVCAFRGLMSQKSAFQAMMDTDVLLVEAKGDRIRFKGYFGDIKDCELDYLKWLNAIRDAE
ncbi:MAG: glycosyltransferase [Planctomycetes bacterium]|nr:glycosyltransferase [Planctomycetota bacterium]